MVAQLKIEARALPCLKSEARAPTCFKSEARALRGLKVKLRALKKRHFECGLEASFLKQCSQPSSF